MKAHQAEPSTRPTGTSVSSDAENTTNKLPPKSSSDVLEKDYTGKIHTCIRPKLDCADYTSNDMTDKLTPHDMENLLVDASFFFKLGFLQPPSCIACAYRHAHHGTDYREAIAAEGCHCLVLWRKDTTIPFHLDNVRENSIVITCQNVKKLLRGEADDADLAGEKEQV